MYRGTCQSLPTPVPNQIHATQLWRSRPLRGGFGGSSGVAPANNIGRAVGELEVIHKIIKSKLPNVESRGILASMKQALARLVPDHVLRLASFSFVSRLVSFLFRFVPNGKALLAQSQGGMALVLVASQD